VFFFSGCNLRCPWCHNRELVTGEAQDLTGIDEGLAHLRKRREVLGGVVLSGGEPCLWKGLPDLIAEIKTIPLPVKLDTNGMFPAMLEKLFSREETRPDYIALDLKLAPARYAELVSPSQEEKNKPRRTRSYTEGHGGRQGEDPGNNLIKSAALIRKSGITHEYRTLALPGGYISEKDIEALAPLVDNAPWYFRPFAGGNCLATAWDDMEEPAEEARTRLEVLAEKARELGKAVCVPEVNKEFSPRTEGE